MSSHYRARVVAIGATLLFLLSFSILHAQVEKRVIFARGKSSATLRGKLPQNYADYDAYIVRAQKGQTLSVTLTTSDPNAYITVYETRKLGPDEDMISAGEDHPRTWSGKLPITSEYSVQVYGARSIDELSTRAAYSIEITVR